MATVIEEEDVDDKKPSCEGPNGVRRCRLGQGLENGRKA